MRPHYKTDSHSSYTNMSDHRYNCEFVSINPNESLNAMALNSIIQNISQKHFIDDDALNSFRNYMMYLNFTNFRTKEQEIINLVCRNLDEYCKSVEISDNDLFISSCLEILFYLPFSIQKAPDTINFTYLFSRITAKCSFQDFCKALKILYLTAEESFQKDDKLPQVICDHLLPSFFERFYPVLQDPSTCDFSFLYQFIIFLNSFSTGFIQHQNCLKKICSFFNLIKDSYKSVKAKDPQRFLVFVSIQIKIIKFLISFQLEENLNINIPDHICQLLNEIPKCELIYTDEIFGLVYYMFKNLFKSQEKLQLFNTTIFPKLLNFNKFSFISTLSIFNYLFQLIQRSYNASSSFSLINNIVYFTDLILFSENNNCINENIFPQKLDSISQIPEKHNIYSFFISTARSIVLTIELSLKTDSYSSKEIPNLIEYMKIKDYDCQKLKFSVQLVETVISQISQLEQYKIHQLFKSVSYPISSFDVSVLHDFFVHFLYVGILFKKMMENTQTLFTCPIIDDVTKTYDFWIRKSQIDSIFDNMRKNISRVINALMTMLMTFQKPFISSIWLSFFELFFSSDQILFFDNVILSNSSSDQFEVFFSSLISYVIDHIKTILSNNILFRSLFYIFDQLKQELNKVDIQKIIAPDEDRLYGILKELISSPQANSEAISMYIKFISFIEPTGSTNHGAYFSKIFTNENVVDICNRIEKTPNYSKLMIRFINMIIKIPDKPVIFNTIPYLIRCIPNEPDNSLILLEKIHMILKKTFYDTPEIKLLYTNLLDMIDNNPDLNYQSKVIALSFLKHLQIKEFINIERTALVHNKCMILINKDDQNLKFSISSFFEAFNRSMAKEKDKTEFLLLYSPILKSLLTHSIEDDNYNESVFQHTLHSIVFTLTVQYESYPDIIFNIFRSVNEESNNFINFFAHLLVAFVEVFFKDNNQNINQNINQNNNQNNDLLNIIFSGITRENYTYFLEELQTLSENSIYSDKLFITDICDLVISKTPRACINSISLAKFVYFSIMNTNPPESISVNTFLTHKYFDLRFQELSLLTDKQVQQILYVKSLLKQESDIDVNCINSLLPMLQKVNSFSSIFILFEMISDCSLSTGLIEFIQSAFQESIELQLFLNSEPSPDVVTFYPYGIIGPFLRAFPDIFDLSSNTLLVKNSNLNIDELQLSINEAISNITHYCICCKWQSSTGLALSQSKGIVLSLIFPAFKNSSQKSYISKHIKPMLPVLKELLDMDPSYMRFQAQFVFNELYQDKVKNNQSKINNDEIRKDEIDRFISSKFDEVLFPVTVQDINTRKCIQWHNCLNTITAFFEPVNSIIVSSAMNYLKILQTCLTKPMDTYESNIYKMNPNVFYHSFNSLLLFISSGTFIHCILDTGNKDDSIFLSFYKLIASLFTNFNLLGNFIPKKPLINIFTQAKELFPKIVTMSLKSPGQIPFLNYLLEIPEISDLVRETESKIDITLDKSFLTPSQNTHEYSQTTLFLCCIFTHFQSVRNYNQVANSSGTLRNPNDTLPTILHCMFDVFKFQINCLYINASVPKMNFSIYIKLMQFFIRYRHQSFLEIWRIVIESKHPIFITPFIHEILNSYMDMNWIFSALTEQNFGDPNFRESDDLFVSYVLTKMYLLTLHKQNHTISHIKENVPNKDSIFQFVQTLPISLYLTFLTTIFQCNPLDSDELLTKISIDDLLSRCESSYDYLNTYIVWATQSSYQIKNNQKIDTIDWMKKYTDMFKLVLTFFLNLNEQIKFIFKKLVFPDLSEEQFTEIGKLYSLIDNKYPQILNPSFTLFRSIELNPRALKYIFPFLKPLLQQQVLRFNRPSINNSNYLIQFFSKGLSPFIIDKANLQKEQNSLMLPDDIRFIYLKISEFGITLIKQIMQKKDSGLLFKLSSEAIFLKLFKLFGTRLPLASEYANAFCYFMPKQSMQVNEIPVSVRSLIKLIPNYIEVFAQSVNFPYLENIENCLYFFSSNIIQSDLYVYQSLSYIIRSPSHSHKLPDAIEHFKPPSKIENSPNLFFAIFQFPLVWFKRGPSQISGFIDFLIETAYQIFVSPPVRKTLSQLVKPNEAMNLIIHHVLKDPNGSNAILNKINKEFQNQVPVEKAKLNFIFNLISKILQMSNEFGGKYEVSKNLINRVLNLLSEPFIASRFFSQEPPFIPKSILKYLPSHIFNQNINEIIHFFQIKDISEIFEDESNYLHQNQIEHCKHLINFSKFLSIPLHSAAFILLYLGTKESSSIKSIFACNENTEINAHFLKGIQCSKFLNNSTQNSLSYYNIESLQDFQDSTQEKLTSTLLFLRHGFIKSAGDAASAAQFDIPDEQLDLFFKSQDGSFEKISEINSFTSADPLNLKILTSRMTDNFSTLADFPYFKAMYPIKRALKYLCTNRGKMLSSNIFSEKIPSCLPVNVHELSSTVRNQAHKLVNSMTSSVLTLEIEKFNQSFDDLSPFFQEQMKKATVKNYEGPAADLVFTDDTLQTLFSNKRGLKILFGTLYSEIFKTEKSNSKSHSYPLLENAYKALIKGLKIDFKCDTFLSIACALIERKMISESYAKGILSLITTVPNKWSQRFIELNISQENQIHPNWFFDERNNKYVSFRNTISNALNCSKSCEIKKHTSIAISDCINFIRYNEKLSKASNSNIISMLSPESNSYIDELFINTFSNQNLFIPFANDSIFAYRIRLFFENSNTLSPSIEFLQNDGQKTVFPIIPCKDNNLSNSFKLNLFFNLVSKSLIRQNDCRNRSQFLLSKYSCKLDKNWFISSVNGEQMINISSLPILYNVISKESDSLTLDPSKNTDYFYYLNSQIFCKWFTQFSSRYAALSALLVQMKIEIFDPSIAQISVQKAGVFLDEIRISENEDLVKIRLAGKIGSYLDRTLLFGPFRAGLISAWQAYNFAKDEISLFIKTLFSSDVENSIKYTDEEIAKIAERGEMFSIRISDPQDVQQRVNSLISQSLELKSEFIIPWI